MSNRKTSSRALLSEALVQLMRPRGLQWAVVLFLVLGIGAGTTYVWRRYASHILQDSSYTLAAERIDITQPPPWIHVDIREKAVLDGSLVGLNLLEPDLAVRVADAFAMHPWVAKVNSTQKRYGRVLVDLVYRRPVAMVRVSDENGPGLFPVDAQGVLLPPEDFAHEQARNEFLQIQLPNPDAWPAGGPGFPWGDLRVHGAAAIAATLLDTWKDLGLEHIVVVDQPDPKGTRMAPTYRLPTRRGTTVLWGHAPGHEASGEPTSRKKLARLLQHFGPQAQLDPRPPEQTLDLSLPDTPGMSTAVGTSETKRTTSGVND
jgi:hypothetical protein